MADYITRIRTKEGDKQIDYNALANLPQIPSLAGCANALKSRASGAAVRVNDVSPIEHVLSCKVRGKNLFNTRDDYNGYGHTYADGTLVVAGQYTNKFISLEDEKTYTFSCQSTRTGTDGGGIFLRAYTADRTDSVNVGAEINTLSPTKSLILPKGYPVLRITFYGYYQESPGTATYTNLMLEEGAAATGYTAYIDPTSVVVTRCGANLLPYPYSVATSSKYGITCAVNSNRSITLSGTATADAQFDLATSLKLPAGTYTLGGNGTNVRARIQHADGTTNYAVNTFTLIDGDDLRIYAVALSGETISYTFFPMLNVGETALLYEPYVGKTYVPSIYDIVDGITSVSPTMTLLTDTANTVVECEYNKDANAVIAELLALINQSISYVSHVELLSANWKGTESPYSQTVALDGITPYSKVDLNPSVEQLSIFYNKDISFVAENEDGVVTVYCIGQKPTDNYTMQVTITEVNANG